VITEGCAGTVFVVTANFCGVPLPQVLLGVTRIVSADIPPAVTVIVCILVGVDVGVHPEGNVQA
jgi:hypothetical protein